MIKHIQIRHFKSLSEVSLNLTPVTLLVGQNGSGKSNIIDSLRFLRDCLIHGLDNAISQRGGMNLLRQYSPTRPFIMSIEVDFDLPSRDNSLDFHYSLKIGGSKNTPKIEEEKARFWDLMPVRNEKDDTYEWVPENEAIQFRRDASGNIYLNDDRVKFPSTESDQLAFPSLERVMIESADSETGSFSFFNTGMLLWRQLQFASVYPNTLREPAKPDPDKRLKEDCSNWASVIKAMKQSEKGKDSINRILSFLSIILPGLEDIVVRTVGGHLSPQFLIREEGASKAHYLDPLQLSDGTLRLVGLFLALYQEPRPKFLAIEEPELTVHPGVLKLLSEAIREVSSETQLIFTTHSPHLLDHFDVSEIRVVEMSNGVTHLGMVRPPQVQMIRSKLMSTSELMALDGLQMEKSQ